MLKGRTVHLLQFLMQQKEGVTTFELASIFNVNVRSVQHDLAELDNWIQKMKWNASLSRIEGSRVLLHVREEERDDILQFVHAQNPQLKIYAPEERRQLILLELFKRDEPMIVKELEIDFGVSESTILRDLKHLHEWVEKRGLNLIRKPNFGIQLDGGELDWRMAAFELIKNYLETVNRLNLQDLLVQLQYNKLAPDRLRYAHFVVLRWLLSEEDFRTLERLLQQSLKIQNYQLTDDAMASLLIHCAIVVHRIKKHKPITLKRNQFQYIKRSTAYSVMQLFAEGLQQNMDGLYFANEEITYLTMHLAGSRFVQPLHMHQREFKTDLSDIVNRLVRTLEVFTNLELQSDRQFISGLYSHLWPMLERLKFGIPMENELLQEVQDKYPDIYTATKLAALSIEDQLPSTVPDDEIGYLTLHVGAAIERKKKGRHFQRKRVALVCGSGLGTSNLLLVQLAREFPEIDIVGCKHAFEVQDLKADHVDLILSTINIQHPTVPVIYIRPLLSTADLEKLRLTLKQNKSSYVYWEGVINEIVQAARRNGLTDTSVFRKNVRDIIYKHISTAAINHEQSIGEDERPMLQDLLHKQTVGILHHISDWREAIKSAGDMLLREGVVEQRYIEAMVRAIREHGPYVVIAPGIALVHARPEDGVNEVCMSLVVCPEGVPFGNPEKDPVQLVFAFGAVDNNQHLRALSQMMTLLNNQEAISRLKAASSTDEVLAVLHDSVPST